MTIPDVIFANNISKGADVPHGILYSIRKIVTNNQILNFVVPSTNYTTYAGNIGDPIKIGTRWIGHNNQYGYYQYGFKDKFVFPTAYSIRGNSDGAFAKEWYFYGINDGEEPVLLATDSNVGTTYCGDGLICNSFNWATFMLKNVKKAFRYFRIKIKTPSKSEVWHMIYTGVDIFGILSSDGRKIVKKSYQTKNSIISYLVLRSMMYIVSL